MHLTARSLIEAIVALGALSSLGFYLLSACGIASFQHVAGSRERPGCHCRSPVIFHDAPQTAFAPAYLACDYFRKIDLLVCSRDLGSNRKLGRLAQMLSAARHEILLVNDSDIRVAPDYLRRVVSLFADPTIGLVTCLYRGIPTPTMGSRLEALGISTDFVPGVLSARLIERGLHFGLGSTLAFRRSDLQAIGGFEAMVDYLADDYEIGNRIAGLGKRIELSEVVVETFLPAYSFGEYVDHQLRWARSVRGARSWGYAGLILTFGLPWAMLALLAARGAMWAGGRCVVAAAVG